MSDDKDSTQVNDNSDDKGNLDPLGIVGWEIGGKYIISSYIDGGGFGEVYQGHNKNLPDQRLVFKFFKRVQSRDKFDKEARILCLLDHPNISRVIDYLPEEGAVVVAFIDGKDGSQILKESGALSEELFLKVGRALSSAIAYAHQKNIAHRDLKPGNVMFDINDHVYLIDFGIAKEIGSQATKTAYQALTPLFAAPERQDGEAEYNPFLSDIFETGVTLFNFATNDLPYRNPSNPNANEWGGSSADKLSPELRRILKKATHPYPEMRYKDASEMAAEFKSLERAFGEEEEPKEKKGGGKALIIAFILVAIAAGAYFGKDHIFNYYEQFTASEKASVEEQEPTLKSVIDSIISEPELPDSIETSMGDSSEMLVDLNAGQDSKTSGDIAEVSKSTVSTKKEETKDEPPQSGAEKKKVVVPKKDEIVVQTSYALTIKSTPDNIHLLKVGEIEASKDSTFMVKYGNHIVVEYHPDYPIYQKTVYMPKKSRTVEIDLKEEYSATPWANLQLAMSPPTDQHVIELAFNGKRHTLMEFPVLDLKRLKGSWLIEASIFSIAGDATAVPRIDSLVTFPHGGGNHSVVKGNQGEIDLGSKDWNDETVPLLIFWSE